MSDLALPPLWPYPERRVAPESAWGRIATGIEAALRIRPPSWRVRALARIVPAVEQAGMALAGLDDAALAALARDAAGALRCTADWPLARVAPVFAAVREAAARRLGQRPHDVQLIGAYALLRGMVAEMGTGEGKTLTASLAAATAALAGVPTHVVTVNGYLTGRDAAALTPLYGFLGLTVGVVTEATPQPARADAYRCDVTYCTNKDLAFDYMRDRLAAGRRLGPLRRKAARLAGGSRAAATRLRGLPFAIVDECDSVLVDEARTPLILSGGGGVLRDAALFDQALAIAGGFRAGVEFAIVPSERRAVLLRAGRERVEALAALGTPWDEPAERDRLIGHALTALHLLHRDEHYLVRDGRAEIIDEYTGRILPDRTWSEGLHETIERKEGLELSERQGVDARMTYQRFFRRYQRLAGMTGTGREVAGELWRVYRLTLVAIPPHRPTRRIERPAQGFRDQAAKWQAIVDTVRRLHRLGAPVLIGTRTLAASEQAGRRLEAAGIPHAVLNAAQDAAEADIVARAGGRGAVTVATNMAGRGTDIRPDAEALVLGGLHVIVSELHEAARIDRQLAGRCARQGDPGHVLTMVALDDMIVQQHAGGLARAAAAALRPLVGSWVVARLARRAQRRAERLHARMRRDLLRSDEWMGDVIAFAGEQE